MAKEKEAMDSKNENEENQLILKRKAGASIIRFKPLFSMDSSSVYIIWNNSVRDYSTKTGQLVRTLMNPSNNQLVCLTYIPEVTGHLYGCTRQGELITWDEQSGLNIKCETLLRSKDQNHEVVSVYFRSVKIVYLIVKSEDTGGHKFLECKYQTKKSGQTKAISHKVKCQKGKHSFSFGGKNHTEFLTCIQEEKLFMVDLDSYSIYTHRGDKKRPFTCVAAHKTEMCVATGDLSGRILIWRDFMSSSVTYNVYHWHTLPVNDIAFTQAGSNFYSGGSENVLVKWLLDMESKNFLPRLGAAIKHIVVSPDNLFVTLSTAENAIILVDPHIKVVQTIQHLSLGTDLGPEQKALCSAGLTVEPHSKALILNSRPGYLQFLSVESQDLMFKLDVVGQNLLTQERETVIVNTDVTRVAVSSDGHWLLTAEERDDKHSHREVRLKFWRSHWLETFKLHTSIEVPHQGALLAIQFQPGISEDQIPRAVSSGTDRKFKVWTLLDDTMEKAEVEDESSWGCEGVGTHQALQAGPLAFSSDGSLLAAAFEHSLTLWIPDSTQLTASLTHPETRKQIRHIQFGRAQCCHLIVVASNDQLCVWNLLTLTLSWTVSLNITCLTSNPMTDHIAAFTKSNQLYIFKPCDEKPMFSQQLNSYSKIIAAVFWPYAARRPQRCSWQQRAQLLFLNEEQELLGLDETEIQFDEEQVEEMGAEVLISDGLAPHYKTAFSAMLAQETKSNVSKSKTPQMWEQQLKANQGSYAHMLCHTAAHMLPPMQLIARDLVKEYLNEQALKVEDVIEMTTETKSLQLKPSKNKPLVSQENVKKKEKSLEKVLLENMDWVKSVLDLVDEPQQA